MQSIVNAAAEAVISLMNAARPFAPVTRGAPPSGAGIACEVGPGRAPVRYLDGGALYPLALILRGKHADLETLSGDMNAIHEALTGARAYPSGRGWKIVDISTAALPHIEGRADNNDWLMASELSVRVYQKGD